MYILLHFLGEIYKSWAERVKKGFLTGPENFKYHFQILINNNQNKFKQLLF